MEEKPESPKLELEKEALENLGIARKWSMFLARLGFVFLALVIICGVMTGAFLSVFNSGAEGIGIPGAIILALIAVLSFFYILPVFYLFYFSKNIDRAIRLNDKSELHKAFKNLKSYFVYLGVLMIILITTYIIVIGIGGALMAFLKIL